MLRSASDSHAEYIVEWRFHGVYSKNHRIIGSSDDIGNSASRGVEALVAVGL